MVPQQPVPPSPSPGIGLNTASTLAAPAPRATLRSSHQEDGSQVVIGAWAEPATLLSGAPVTGAVYQQIQRIIANGLTKLAYPGFEVEPDLAESWQVSEDALVYNFTLRSGVKWQDGQPFTAADVKYTFDVVSDPEWPGALDSYFSYISGAKEHKAGEATEATGVTVIDDTHVQFTLTQPDTLFLVSALSRQRILPKHILEQLAPADIEKSDFARKPVYTGAYAVEEWRPGESITFRAFPDYFGGKAGIDTLIARFIPDPATAIAELQTGALQIGVVNPDQFPSFQSDSSFTTQELPASASSTSSSISPIPSSATPASARRSPTPSIAPPSSRPSTSAKANPPPASSPPSPGSTTPTSRPIPTTSRRPTRLLTEAGWTPGDDGVRVNANGDRLSFTLTVPTVNLQDGLALQPFLEAIGVEIAIDEQGAGEVTGPLKIGEFQAAISAWNNFIIDPRADLQRNFQNPRPTDGTGYKNDEVDALFIQARGALDQETEKQLYFQIQNLIETDTPLAYLWRQQDLVVVHQSLTVPQVSTVSELYARIPEWTITG